MSAEQGGGIMECFGITGFPAAKILALMAMTSSLLYSM